MSELTERDIRLLHDQNPAVLVALDWTKERAYGSHTYESFVGLVDRGLTWVVKALGENPRDAGLRTENDLTREIGQQLRAMGFEVGFDATVGGHCDLVVTYGTRYSWLAEAKIYGGYKWLYKGYLQLLTRYSTGAVDADRGGMLIYFKAGDLPAVMANWGDLLRGKIMKRNRNPITVTPVLDPACSFTSEQTHDRTNRPYRVKHYAVSLIWSPENA